MFPDAVSTLPFKISKLDALNVPDTTLPPPYIANVYVIVPVPLKLVTLNGYNLAPEASENDTGSVSVAVISLAIVSVLPTNDSGVGFKVVVVVVKIYAAPLFDVPLLAPSSKCAPAIA